MEFKFNQVGIDSILRVLDGVAIQGESTTLSLSDYTALSTTTVTNAARNLVVLGLVVECSRHSFALTVSYDPSWQAGRKRVYLRSLVESQPVVHRYDIHINGGEDSISAKRRALIETEHVGNRHRGLDNLLQLRTNLGHVDIKMAESTDSATDEPKKHEESVHAKISSLVGAEYIRFLSETEYAYLAQALSLAGSEPEQSFITAGKCIESLLRRIGDESGISVAHLHGIGQLADYLSSKKRLILHPTHRDLLRAPGTLRNIAGHGTDEVTLDAWGFTREMAACNAAFVATLLGSILSWAYSRELSA